jgi:hypothetical protein
MIAAVLAVTAASVSTAALAQSMVVRSTGPSAAKYPVGKKLAANEKITLIAGDRVVLLSKDTTRTLAKPGTYNASGTTAATSTLSSTMAAMISREGALRRRGGATRGEPVVAAARAPNLWYVDARTGGTFCVLDPARLVLWRADAKLEQSARVVPQGGSSTPTLLTYKANNTLKLWPTASLPVQTGATYQVTGAGQDKPVTIRFELFDTVPATSDEIAAKLLARGCMAQLDRLVDTMAAEEKSAG